MATTAESVLRQLLPPGMDEAFDLSPGSDFEGLLAGIADALQTHGYDALDALRLETNPRTAAEKIPEWEIALGLTGTPQAQSGTIDARRANVLFRLRETGAPTVPNAKLMAKLLLGYEPEILETPRDLLTEAHRWTDLTGASKTVPAHGSATWTIYPLTDGVVSPSGAQVLLDLGATVGDVLRVTLTSQRSSLAPDHPARIRTWGSIGRVFEDESGARSVLLMAPEFAGAPAWLSDWPWNPAWTVVVENTGNEDATVGASLFVEGIGRVAGHSQLGGNIFEWGVFVDPTQNDFTSFDWLLRQLRRINPAHCLVRVIRGSRAISPGAPLAISDDPDCIPDQVIPA